MSSATVPRSRPDVFAEAPERVLAGMASGADGLTGSEAETRLARDGRNEIPRPPGPTVLAVFVRQFLSPLIYVLLVAAGLSAWLEEWADAVFIAAVLLLNAVIGAVQETRAGRSAQALQTLLTARVEVIRDGDLSEVDAAEIVVGDVVLLSSGNRVPADLRLLETQNLQIDESSLTGESLPVDKDAHRHLGGGTLLADRVTMAYAGTMTVRGRGRGVVTATGAETALGGLAGQLHEPAQAEPPLLVRMRRFTGVIGISVGLAALVMGGLELMRGTVWHEVLLIAVALAVSAIPEGLPVAITVALAVAGNRMARRKVIVRHLVAIETLGSCTVVASDKTGTLTVNQLTVVDLALPGSPIWRVTGVDADPVGTVMVEGCDPDEGLAAAERLARAGVLCNEGALAREEDSWAGHGDAVDVALLVLGHKLGITRPHALAARPVLSVIPFEPEHRYAASAHQVEPGRVEVVVKGALEQVLGMCATAREVGGVAPLDAASVQSQARRLAASGRRVLALASGPVPVADPSELGHDDLHGLTLLGLVGMSDPLRPDAITAVSRCARAGVGVVMMTGDHPDTALSIARELGLAETAAQVVSGTELRAAVDQGPGAVDQLTARAKVFARIEPIQKLSIVESLTRRGEVVAVTGDGANDAPALHHAHVGVAMGRSGTDVAREAADVVVTDDSFEAVAAGVNEGRVAYANIRKVVALLIATGAGELVLVLGALAWGLPLPLIAVQLLWLNLVTNGIQDVALAFEPAEGDEMARPPRAPGEPIFNRLMVERVLLSAAVIGGITLLAYHWMIGQGWSPEAARNSAVLLMVLFENVQVFNTRSELRSVFALDPRRNPLLLGGTILAQLVHVVAMQLPATQHVLGLAPIGIGHWLVLFALALTLLVAVEAHKALCRRREACALREGTPDRT